MPPSPIELKNPLQDLDLNPCRRELSAQLALWPTDSGLAHLATRQAVHKLIITNVVMAGGVKQFAATLSIRSLVMNRDVRIFRFCMCRID